MLKKIFYNWSPVLIYFLIIFILSSAPVHIPSGSDKVLHFIEYGLMGFLTTRGFLLTWDLSRWRGGILGALTGGILGVFDEFHQSFVPGRMASGYDALADLLGASLGALLFVYLGVFLYKSRKLYARSNDKCC